MFMNSSNADLGGTLFGQRFPGLDPEMAALLDRAAAAGLAPLTSLSPEAARQRVAGGNVTRDEVRQRADSDDLAIPDGPFTRVYRPASARPEVALVYLHGGGWVTGDLDYSDEICRILADRAAVTVVSADYRLAPEHPFPAAVDDALRAVDWVAQGGLGRPVRVVVAGDSAGGGLAAVCAQRHPAVTGQLLLYPALDCDVTTASYRRNSGVVLGAAEMSWFFDQYVPDTEDRTDPRFAPIRTERLEQVPDAVVVVAGHDPLRDEGAAYADALSAAGVAVDLHEFDSLPHGFLRFTSLVPAAAAAADQVGELAAELVRRSSTMEGG
jgi:acetyl esterase